MSAVLPRWLIDNRADDTGVVAAYSGVEQPGFEITNSSDWRDFTLFQVEVGVTTLDYTLAANADIDSAAIWNQVISGITGDVKLSYESAPAVFTVLATFSATMQNSKPKLKTFDKVTVLSGRKVRWEFDITGGTANFRQLTAGVINVAPIGQRDGLTPPNLSWGFVVNNQISVNGSIISRSTRRLDRRTDLILEFLSETYVRNDWEVTQTHMARKAMWYAWDLDRFPLEVTFASAESIDPPVNTTPTPFMTVTMPLRNLE